MRDDHLGVKFLLVSSMALIALSGSYLLITNPSSNYITGRVSEQGSVSLVVGSPDTGGSSPAGGGGGGGGGGGSASTPGISNFSVSPTEFNLMLGSDSIETYEITVENTGDEFIVVDFSVTGIDEFIGLESNSISLASGLQRSLLFTVYSGSPGVYAGKLILASQGIIREVFLLLNVVSEDVLFDVSITIPEVYKSLKSGQDLPTFIELLEIGGGDGLDVTVRYFIDDFDGNTYFEESETFFVQGSRNYNKEFDTSELLSGDYLVGIELTYPNGVATSSSYFEVVDNKISTETIYSLIGLVVAILVIIFAWIYYKRRDKKEKKVNKKKKVKSKK